MTLSLSLPGFVVTIQPLSINLLQQFLKLLASFAHLFIATRLCRPLFAGRFGLRLRPVALVEVARQRSSRPGVKAARSQSMRRKRALARASLCSLQHHLCPPDTVREPGKGYEDKKAQSLPKRHIEYSRLKRGLRLNWVNPSQSRVGIPNSCGVGFVPRRNRIGAVFQCARASCF